MGLVLATLLLAVGVGRLTGGRVRELAACRMAAPHLLVVAFGVQAAQPLLTSAVPYSYPLAFAVSGTLLAQFVIRNTGLPGIPLAGLGLLLNAAVIILNGAMPVSLEAAARSGVSVEQLDLAGGARHEPLDAGSRLAPLADVVPTPVPGLREVTSAGDLLLAAGLGLFVFSGMQPRRTRARGSAVADAPPDDAGQGLDDPRVVLVKREP